MSDEAKKDYDKALAEDYKAVIRHDYGTMTSLQRAVTRETIAEMEAEQAATQNKSAEDFERWVASPRTSKRDIDEYLYNLDRNANKAG